MIISLSPCIYLMIIHSFTFLLVITLENVHPWLSYSLIQTIIFTTSLIDIKIFYLFLLLPTFCVILCILIYIYLKPHYMLILFCFIKSTLIYIFPLFFFYLFSYSSFLLTFLCFHLGSSLFYLNKFLSCFFFKAGWMLTNSVFVYLKRLYIAFIFEDNFGVYRFLDWQLLHFSPLKLAFHCLVASTISVESKIKVLVLLCG